MTTFLRIVVIASAVSLAVAILVLGSRLRANSLGSPPIAKPAFVLAKLGITVSFILLILRAVLDPPQLTLSSGMLCICLLIGGTLVFTLGLYELGANLRMGLPQEQTCLVKSGIYGRSRNPIYVGLYMMLAASLIYAFSWLNVAAVLAGVVLHHRIVLSEERFLTSQFKEYEAYCKAVRRYI